MDGRYHGPVTQKIEFTDDAATNINVLREALLQHFEDDHNSFSSIENHLKDLKSSMQDLSKKTDPVAEWFQNVTFSKKLLLQFITFIGTIVAILFGITQVLLYFKQK